MALIFFWLTFMFVGHHANLRESPSRVEHLRVAARNLPDVATIEMTDQLVDAAVVLQTPHVPAALIVALAWGESRFDPMAQPGCGVMQVFPKDLDEPASACITWRNDLQAGIRAGVREIELMLGDGRVHGNLRLALLYRACGNKAFNGTCTKHTWVTNALNRWRALAAHQAAS